MQQLELDWVHPTYVIGSKERRESTRVNPEELSAERARFVSAAAESPEAMFAEQVEACRSWSIRFREWVVVLVSGSRIEKTSEVEPQTRMARQLERAQSTTMDRLLVKKG
jgi:hypothetical protein